MAITDTDLSSTVLTPSPHLSAYSPDDNRYDLRPFLLVVNWPWQFNKIKAHLAELEKKIEEKHTKGGESNEEDEGFDCGSKGLLTEGIY